MKKFESMFRLFAAAFMTLIFAALAAAAPQVFVSYKGSDTNPCDRNTPCATFAAAVNQVDAGGEVIVLDSGNYKPVTITKALQIVASDGVTAGVSAYNSPITVAAGVSDSVVLRGLTLTYNGGDGIFYQSGGSLYVENCLIHGFTYGIRATGSGKLFVQNTVLRNNFVGVFISLSSGALQAFIDRTTIENGSYGFYAYGTVQSVVSGSSSSGNLYDGFYVGGTNAKMTLTGTTSLNNGRYGFYIAGGVPSSMTLDGCTASGNGDAGIYGGGGGLPGGVYVRVSDSVSTNNKYGFYALGFFESYGNNRVRGNTTNISGTITTVGQN